MNFGKQKWNKLAKFKFQYSLILKNQAVKASDAEKTMFKKECKRIMCVVITKFQERSPLKSFIVGCSSSLSPVNIVKEKNSVEKFSKKRTRFSGLLVLIL